MKCEQKLSLASKKMVVMPFDGKLVKKFRFLDVLRINMSGFSDQYIAIGSKKFGGCVVLDWIHRKKNLKSECQNFVLLQ